MKQLYYTFISLIRGRNSNIIKVISLTLGLFTGLLTFARIVFELNSDSHYDDIDGLFRVKAHYTINNEKEKEPDNILFEPVAGAIKENFPDEVEYATVVRHFAGNVYFNGSHRIDDARSIYADSLYFQTMGIRVLKGNPLDLSLIDVIFISESLSRKLYGEDDPLGKILNKDKKYPLTIKGVFKDLPENTTLLHDIVISFPTIHKISGRTRGGWHSDDSFMGYVRLRNPGDVSKVNDRLETMISKYLPDNGANGFKAEFLLKPIKGDYISDSTIRMILMILTLLAITLLVIPALNYILISVSSFAGRAKTVAIHKCSGASAGNVISMFLMETAILIFISLLLVAFLLLNFKDFVEDIAFASLGALFTWQTLSILALIAVLLFLFVGVLPGRLLAVVPVTQIFRKSIEQKTSWKRPLLFIQFTGVTFIFGLLTVVLLEYNLVMNKNLGYNPDNVAIANTGHLEDSDFLKDELLRMPAVEKIGIASLNLLSGWGGMPVYNANGDHLFTTRWNKIDKDYLSLMKIQLKEGRNIDGPEQLLVNETFVRLMNWTESPVGKPLPEVGLTGVVVGVVKDFPVNNRLNPIAPVVIEGDRKIGGGQITVRVKELTPELLASLNKKAEELYPLEDIQFVALNHKIEEQYEGIRRFRDSVVVSTVVILLITLMGLFGYVNDEIRRRSKEIAIRKVNGAESWNILSLVSQDILRMAFPAVVSGSVIAYFIGNWWLEMFSERITMSIPLFALLTIAILCLILGCVIVRVWHTANENPVNSIKSE